MILPGKIFRTGITASWYAIFGNFVNRTFVLMHKLCRGQSSGMACMKIMDDTDTELIREIEQTKIKVENCIENL